MDKAEMITAEELADRMIDEIRRDQIEGVIPQTIKNFSELHDYVDANTYGGTEQLLETYSSDNDGSMNSNQIFQEFIAVMSNAISIVEQRLSESPPENEPPSE